MGLRKQLLFWLFCTRGSCAVPLQGERQAAGEAAEKLQMLLPKKL